MMMYKMYLQISEMISSLINHILVFYLSILKIFTCFQKVPKKVLVPDLQEIDASKEVKKKVIFMSQFCPLGSKRYYNRGKNKWVL